MASGGNNPVKVITLGKWSAAIFYDSVGDRYSTNLRRSMSREEVEKAKVGDLHPESLLLFEEDPLTIAEICTMVSAWIREAKVK